jgi:hypothetical protein
MKKGLISVSVFGIGLSIFVWVWTAAVFPPGTDNQIGSAFFPRVLAGGLILLCIALLVQTIRKKKHGEGFAFSFRNPAFLRVFVTLTASFIFAVLLKLLGFIICAVLLLTGLMYMLGSRKVVEMIVVSLVTALIVQVVFEKFLGIVLPYGVLEPLFYFF